MNLPATGDAAKRGSKRHTPFRLAIFNRLLSFASQNGFKSGTCSPAMILPLSCGVLALVHVLVLKQTQCQEDSL